ncbi:MAG: hypothetical protein IJJ33_03830, partial [Victivallales bacterium]|nr:hypothetical protein [Victivallales bacterium]
MTTRFYIIFFWIFLAAALFHGCRRQEASAYDEDEQAKNRLDLCEALLKGDLQQADKSLQTLMERAPEDDFTAEAGLFIRRGQQVEKMTELLQKGDFNGLREFIQSKANSGDAGLSLLELDELPDALETLAHFRKKMPWETSASLQEALQALERRGGVLEQYPSFQRFLQEQQETLAQLKSQEAKRRAQELLQKMSAALLSGQERVFKDAEAAFRKAQPDHTYFAYQSMLERGQAIDVPAELTDFYCLALAHSWPSLTAEQRVLAGACLLRLRNASSPLAQLCRARISSTPQAFE